jgi:hypothetical protein
VRLTLHARFGRGPSEKDPETGTSSAAYLTAEPGDWPSCRSAPYNWPDTGPGARLRKQADVCG